MRKGRLFIIGLDGADYYLVSRWMNRGLLPNMHGIAQAGSFGRLKSTIPPDTMVAWPSIFTGATPGYHGIWGSYHWNLANQSAQIVSADHCAMPTFWEVLNKAGYTTGLFQVPLTYPPNPLNGWMVTPSTQPTFTYPKGLGSHIRQRFPQYRYYLDLQKRRLQGADEREILSEVSNLLQQQAEVARTLIKEHPCDIYFLVFQPTDWVSHKFESPERDGNEGQHEDDPLLPIYQDTDRVVGSFRSLMKDNDALLILSDHGSQTCRGGLALNSWLLKNGYLCLKRNPRVIVKRWIGRTVAHYLWTTRLAKRLWYSSLRKSRSYRGKGEDRQDAVLKQSQVNLIGIDDIAWGASRAYETGWGEIWLAHEDAESRGILRRQIAQRLLNEHGPRGTGCIAAVHETADLYPGPHIDTGPDLIVESTDWAYIRYTDIASGLARFVNEVPSLGLHSRNGIYLTYGEGWGKQGMQDVFDVTPAILRRYGLPLTGNMR